jgi:hypothetical protein
MGTECDTTIFGLLFTCFAVLSFELRALHLLGKCSTTWAMLLAFCLFVCLFEEGSCWLKLKILLPPLLERWAYRRVPPCLALCSLFATCIPSFLPQGPIISKRLCMCLYFHILCSTTVNIPWCTNPSITFLLNVTFLRFVNIDTWSPKLILFLAVLRIKPGLVHARQALYQWALSPALSLFFSTAGCVLDMNRPVVTSEFFLLLVDEGHSLTFWGLWGGISKEMQNAKRAQGPWWPRHSCLHLKTRTDHAQPSPGATAFQGCTPVSPVWTHTSEATQTMACDWWD